MSQPPDDDPLPDWAQLQQQRTAVDEVPALPASEVPTAPHRTLGQVDRAFADGKEIGYLGGWKACRDDAERALRELFDESPGGFDEAAEHTVARWRSKLTVV